MDYRPLPDDRKTQFQDYLHYAFSLEDGPQSDHDEDPDERVGDERALFEKLCLESFQAGLSWLTILRKRDAFREAFAGFDPEAVAGFGSSEVTRLLADRRIVRNRAKIEAAISNAKVLWGLHDQGRSLTEVVWDAAPPPRPRPGSPDAVPASTPASTSLATALKREGFRFVGPTTAYAFMQAMGLVDDHLAGCWVPAELTGPAA